MGGARLARSAFGSCTTSGAGSLTSHSSILSNSFRWNPSSPLSIEMVSSPSERGSVEIDPDEAALISHGASNNLSNARGARRKNRTFCCRYTLMPPKNTRSSLTFGSSVSVGV